MNERARQRKGIIGTIIFHAVVLIFFILAGFTKPKDLLGEEGILVNFGYDEAGFGQMEPAERQELQENESSTSASQSFEESQEDIMTQDFEEAPVAEQQAKEDEKEEHFEENISEQEQVEEEAQETEPEPTIDESALYSGRTDNEEAGSEGISEGEGNQGSITGEENVNNYADANSRGKGGVSFSLDGRNPQVLPKPEYQFQEEGKVVVEIKVNQQGKVISAIPGVKGSSTLDSYLLKVAKKAALRSSFNRDPNAPNVQKGTITYFFKLN